MLSPLAAIIAAAVVFVWLGMVLAISFLEAPLKFTAPGITIPLGLGIGRRVFRALNAVEALLAVVTAVLMAVGVHQVAADVTLVVIAVVLAYQLLVVRPRLNRRSDEVLATGVVTEERSGGHHAYVVLECIKVVGLILLGVLLCGVALTA